MKKVITYFFLIAAFAFLLTGCAQKQKEASEDTFNQPLKIGVLFIEDNLPFFLAEAEKRFEKEGLNVELIPFKSAAERDAALQAGQIDGEAADIVAACLLRKGGTDVKISSITLGVTPQEGRFVLLGSPDSSFKSAKELVNVKIAISENTIIEYITDTLLQQEGIKIEDIQKLSVPQMPIRLQMLVNNQVKAALLPDPLASLAEKQGAKIIIDDTKTGANVSQVVLLFRNDSIEKKRDAIARLIQVYGNAAKDLTENPAKYRPLLIGKAKIPEPIKDTYKSPSFSAPQAPAEQDVMNVVNWMVEKKLLEKPFTYEEIVESSLVK